MVETKEISELTRSNRIAMLSHISTVTVMVFFMIWESVRGQLSPVYMTIATVVGVIPLIGEVICWKGNTEHAMIKHLVSYGFALFYTICLFTSPTNLIYVFVIPMIFVVTIYSDTRYLLLINTGTILESIIVVVIGATKGGFGYHGIEAAVVQIVVMIMVGANSVLTTKVIRENTRKRFTEVAVAVEEIGNSMTLTLKVLAEGKHKKSSLGVFQSSEKEVNAYSGVNTNSKQYKALKEKGWLSGIMQNEAMMSPEERMIYETFGGRDTIIKNLMKQFDSEGDLLNANGVAGMDVTGKGTSWQQLTSVSEEYRQKMFDNVKKEFIQENGLSNGDTTKRSDIFKDYQLSVSKDKRLSGTWTLEQYEGQYRAAMYAAVKSANPNWKPGQKFDTSILDNVTRESVEATLVKNGNRLVRNSIDVSVQNTTTSSFDLT